MPVEMTAHEVTASSGATGSTLIERLVLLPPLLALRMTVGFFVVLFPTERHLTESFGLFVSASDASEGTYDGTVVPGEITSRDYRMT
jgi:hypothetical protein